VFDFWAWCVGSNPPSVVCGIRLIGLPALSRRRSSAHVCPFHLQDGRFTESSPAHSTSQTLHSPVRVDVSFLLRCQASRLAPLWGCNSTCGRSFLKPRKFGARKPHTNSPAHLKGVGVTHKHTASSWKNHAVHRSPPACTKAR
jgi:hypothetical protein